MATEIIYDENGVDTGLRRIVSKIIGGERTFDYPEVAKLIIDTAAKQQVCTGTLITPRHVLTAKHCVGQAESADITISFEVNEHETLSFKPKKITSIAGKWEGNVYLPDIAVIELDGFVQDEHCKPATLYGFVDESIINKPVTGVGYGYSDLEKTQIGEKRFGTFQITNVGPTGRRNTTDKLYVTNVNGQMACQGDSGSPLFITDRDGKKYVLGVFGFTEDSIKGPKSTFTCDEKGGYEIVAHHILPILEACFPFVPEIKSHNELVGFYIKGKLQGIDNEQVDIVKLTGSGEDILSVEACQRLTGHTYHSTIAEKVLYVTLGASLVLLFKHFKN